MNTVKSKYKNPDRYIERLKNDVKWAYQQYIESYNLYYDERGERIIEWAKEATDGQKVLSQNFGVLRPGDIIHRVDRVTKVIIEKDSSTIELDMIEVRKVK